MENNLNIEAPLKWNLETDKIDYRKSPRKFFEEYTLALNKESNGILIGRMEIEEENIVLYVDIPLLKYTIKLLTTSNKFPFYPNHIIFHTHQASDNIIYNNLIDEDNYETSMRLIANSEHAIILLGNLKYQALSVNQK